MSLKRHPNVVFVGIDTLDDIMNNSYNELFVSGGCIISDELVLNPDFITHGMSIQQLDLSSGILGENPVKRYSCGISGRVFIFFFLYALLEVLIKTFLLADRLTALLTLLEQLSSPGSVWRWKVHCKTHKKLKEQSRY